MLAIIAILSDIPTAVLSFVEQLTGMDMSSVSIKISDVFSLMLDIIG